MKRILSFITILLVSLGAAGCGAGADLVPVSKIPEAKEITAHYCLVAETLEERQWRQLYEELHAEGLKEGVYVEALNDDLPEDYTKAERFKAAIAIRPDGIFLEGDATEETASLVAEAADAGIPVITLRSDTTSDKRISHIESGNYALGRAYGGQILAAAAEKGGSGIQDVLVIMEEDADVSGRGVVVSAMIEAVAEDPTEITLNVTTESVGVGVFNSAQAIRRRILAVERVPDYVVLFSDRDTMNVYQVLVDYNRIGDVTVIGSSSAETILDAVQRGAVQAVILTDAHEMAEEAIAAMHTYRTTGHVSDYFAADTIVINAQNAKEYLADDTP